jgi:hypothetical protein
MRETCSLLSYILCWSWVESTQIISLRFILSILLPLTKILFCWVIGLRKLGDKLTVCIRVYAWNNWKAESVPVALDICVFKYGHAQIFRLFLTRISLLVELNINQNERYFGIEVVEKLNTCFMSKTHFVSDIHFIYDTLSCSILILCPMHLCVRDMCPKHICCLIHILCPIHCCVRHTFPLNPKIF